MTSLVIWRIYYPWNRKLYLFQWARFIKKWKLHNIKSPWEVIFIAFPVGKYLYFWYDMFFFHTDSLYGFNNRVFLYNYIFVVRDIRESRDIIRHRPGFSWWLYSCWCLISSVGQAHTAKTQQTDKTKSTNKHNPTTSLHIDLNKNILRESSWSK